MIGEWVRKETAGCFRWVAGILVRTGITANTVTVLGMILSAFVAYFIIVGQHVEAAIVLAIAGLLDGLDGSLARASGRQTPFGAFWDSTLDRLSESIVFLGMLIFYVSEGFAFGVVLIYVAVVGSLMVSYVRARAEGLGLTCSAGLMTRFERVFLLMLGLIFNQLVIALLVLVILSVVTVLQRMYLVWTALEGGTAKRRGMAAYGQEGKQ
jgi:CDP-diacylglycerol---glycerol-3-phosphate 3-phosphatidyltransferase